MSLSAKASKDSPKQPDVAETSTYPMLTKTETVPFEKFNTNDPKWLFCFNLIHIETGFCCFGFLDVTVAIVLISGGSFYYALYHPSAWVKATIVLGVICFFSAISAMVGAQMSSQKCLLIYMALRAIMIVYDFTLAIIVVLKAALFQAEIDANKMRTTPGHYVVRFTTANVPELTPPNPVSLYVYFVILLGSGFTCVWFFFNALKLYRYFGEKHKARVNAGQ